MDEALAELVELTADAATFIAPYGLAWTIRAAGLAPKRETLAFFARTLLGAS